MKRTDWLKTLSWMVPLGCFVLAGVLVFLQYQRMKLRSQEVEETKKLTKSLQETVDSWKTLEGRERIPSVADTRQEEATFLDEVRQVAIVNGVKLVKWVNEGNDPTRVAPPLTPEQEAQIPAAVRGVRTLASNVEVSGTWVGVRGFVHDLLSSERLLTVKSGVWSRGDSPGETGFSFKLNRYVSQPEAAAPASPSSDARPVAQR